MSVQMLLSFANVASDNNLGAPGRRLPVVTTTPGAMARAHMVKHFRTNRLAYLVPRLPSPSLTHGAADTSGSRGATQPAIEESVPQPRSPSVPASEESVPQPRSPSLPEADLSVSKVRC